jgi:hypothetical protein
MSTQTQLLQELFILATGRPANTSNLTALESLVGPDGNLHVLDDVINTYMDAQEAQLGTIGIVRAVARHALGFEITEAQANQAANDLQAAGLDTWAKIFHWLANNDTALTTALDHRGAAAAHFTAQLRADGKSAYFTGPNTWTAATNLIQAVNKSTQSVENAKVALSSLSDALSADGIQSAVVDGYIAGATVIADSNGNGVLDWTDANGNNAWDAGEGEWFGTTDAAGNYTLPTNAPLGTIVASGGTDIMTGKSFQGVLTAPAGSTIVNPLTTLVQSLVESGQSVGDAQTAVSTALGLPADVNPLAYDPLKVLASAGTSDTDKAKALAVQTTALQVANVITQAGNAINSASGANSSLVESGKAVANAIATALKSAADNGGTLNLANADTLTSIVTAAATTASNSTGVTVPSTLASQVATITSASNTAANSATNITDLSKAAVVAQGDATQAIINGASSGNLSQAVNNFTGTNLDNAVNNATPGVITPGTELPPSPTTPTPAPPSPSPSAPSPAPSGSSDAGDETGQPPAPTPSPTPPFTVSDLDDVITFGGTATGKISVAFNDDGIASFTRGGITATTTIADIGTKQILIAAGQELVVDVDDSPYLARGAAFSGEGTLSGEVLISDYENIDLRELESAGSIALTLAGSADELSDNSWDFLSTDLDVRISDGTALPVATAEAIDALWGKVALVSLRDTYAALAAVATDASFRNSNVNIEIASSAATIAQLAALDAVWGSVTPTTVADVAANLDEASDSPYESSNVDVTVTDPASIEQLAQIDALWGNVTATTVADTAANLEANTGAYISGTAGVIVTNAASLSQLTAIGLHTNGMVGYSSVADTAAALAADSLYRSNVVSATVTDAATIAELTTIGHNWGTVTYTQLADGIDALAPGGDASAWIVDGTSINVTDAATIAQIDAIDTANGSGALTYAALADTAANLAPGGASPRIFEGTHVSITNGLSLAALEIIDTANGSAEVEYSTIVDGVTNLVANARGYITGTVNVDIQIGNGDGPPSISQIGTVKSYTSGNVTYAGIRDTATNLATNDGGHLGGNVTFNAIDPATVAQLTQIDSYTTATPASWLYSLSDTFENLDAAPDDYILQANAIVVTDAITFAKASAFLTEYAAVKDKIEIDAIDDTVSNTLQQIIDMGNDFPADLNLTLTNAATIADLITIKAAVAAGSLTYTAIADRIDNLLDDNGTFVVAGTDVTITDPVDIASLAIIDSRNGNGTLTYSLSDTADNLAPGGDASAWIVNGTSINVIDAATIAQIDAIDTANGSGTLTYAALADTAANLVPSGASPRILGGTHVTVTGTASIAQLTAIDAANTTGTLAYTSITDILSNILLLDGPSDYVLDGTHVSIANGLSLAALEIIDTANGSAEVEYSTIVDGVTNLVANARGYVTGTVNVDIQIGNGDGPPSISQVGTVKSYTSGNVTYAGIRDTATNLATNDGGHLGGNVTFNAIDPATVAQLTQIDSYTTATPASWLYSLSDTFENLDAAPDDYILQANAIVVTDAITFAEARAFLTEYAAVKDKIEIDALADTVSNTLQQIIDMGNDFPADLDLTLTTAGTIDELTTIRAAMREGNLRYSWVADTIGNLNANVGNFIQPGINVHVIGVVSLSELTALDLANGAGTVTYADIQAFTGGLVGNPGGYVKDSVNVTFIINNDAGAPTLADIETVDGYTSGTLTYSKVKDTGVNLVANTKGYLSGNVAFFATDLLTIEQLEDIDAHVDSLPSTWTYSLGDTFANLDAANPAYIANALNVYVTDAPSFSEAIAFINAFDDFDVDINIEAIADTVDNTLARIHAMGEDFPANLNLTLIDAGTVAELTTIKAALPQGVMNYSQVADTINNLNASIGVFVKPNINVEILDRAAIAQLGSIDSANGTGTITYTELSGASSVLVLNAAGYVKGNVNVTFIIPNDQSAPSLDDIHKVKGFTSGTLSYDKVRDTAANLAANTKGYLTGDIAFVASTPATVLQLTQILEHTTSTNWLYDLEDTLANLDAADPEYIWNAFDIHVTNHPSFAQALGFMAKFAAFDGEINIGGIADTVDNTLAQITGMGDDFPGDLHLTLIDAGTLEELATIKAAVPTGNLTYSSVADTIDKLNINAGGFVKPGIHVHVTGPASLAQLTGIDNVNGTGTVTASEVSGLTVGLVENTAGYVAGNVNVTFTIPHGSVAPSLADIDTVASFTSGTLSYSTVRDSASNLAANTDGYLSGNVAVVITNPVTIEQLEDIDAHIDSLPPTWTYSIRDTFAHLDAADPAYIENAEEVTISDAVTFTEVLTFIGEFDDIDLELTELADTVSNTLGMIEALGEDYPADVNLTLLDAGTLEEIAAIHAALTTATLTYSVADTAINLIANVGNFVKAGIDVTILGPVSTEHLATIDAMNGDGKLTFDPSEENDNAMRTGFADELFLAADVDGVEGFSENDVVIQYVGLPPSFDGDSLVYS